MLFQLIEKTLYVHLFRESESVTVVQVLCHSRETVIDCYYAVCAVGLTFIRCGYARVQDNVTRIYEIMDHTKTIVLVGGLCVNPDIFLPAFQNKI